MAGMLAAGLCVSFGATGVFAAGNEVRDNLEEAREISIWLYKDDYKLYGSYDENPIVTYLNDKFNCTLSFQQPAMGSEQEQFSLMLGTSSYTDIMEISNCQDSVLSLYADGVIKDLAPYLESAMPNFYEFLQAPENEDVKKALYDEEGHLFTIPVQVATADRQRWGGLVYRRDILETMTGGYIAFPSGAEEPETIEDWEYMLSLFKMYFDAAGMADSACLILPYNGYFQSGELLTGFGLGGDFYVEDGIVKFGPAEDNFYQYLTTMKDWYEKGYIYKDFASRTNDTFYLPNTALTYGGAAGAFFGLNSQLGEAMSMPEYGLMVNVQPMMSPLDTATTEERLAYTSLENSRVSMDTSGYVVSESCSEEDMLRFMTVADYLFTEEGAMVRSYGLTAEQGAADNVYYAENGLADGAYTMKDGEFAYADLMLPGVGEISTASKSIAFIGYRLPGLFNNTYENQFEPEINTKASKCWKGTGTENNFPSSISFSVEENDIKSDNYSTYTDYLFTMVPKFIMGTEELTEESFAAFQKRLNSLGVEECKEIYQERYDAYIAE